MKKNPAALIGALLALAAVDVRAEAASGIPSGLGLYYSYANQKFAGIPSNPEGSGVGLQGQWNLTPNLFVDGLYQYSNEHAAAYSDGFFQYPGVALRNQQARLGGGLQFSLPQSPFTLFGKIDYVDYGFRETAADSVLLDNHDAGPGYFLGFEARGAGLRFYAQGGYLGLSDSHGQEGLGGIAFPLAGLLGPGVPVELLAEYRWTHLTEQQSGLRDIYYDYHLGLNFPLLY